MSKARSVIVLPHRSLLSLFYLFPIIYVVRHVPRKNKSRALFFTLGKLHIRTYRANVDRVIATLHFAVAIAIVITISKAMSFKLVPKGSYAVLPSSSVPIRLNDRIRRIGRYRHISVCRIVFRRVGILHFYRSIFIRAYILVEGLFERIVNRKYDRIFNSVHKTLDLYVKKCGRDARVFRIERNKGIESLKLYLCRKIIISKGYLSNRKFSLEANV